MKTRHWNSNIITFQDDSSFSLVCANKDKGWFLSLGYFLLTLGLVVIFIVLKAVNLALFLKIIIFFLIILYFLLNKTIASIPVGTDCYLYLTDKELRYQFYHLGYTEITHPLKAINKISLSSDSKFLEFYLYKNRIIETIDIPIKFPKEAARALQEVYTFLERQGVVLPPPIIPPPSSKESS